MGEGLSVGAPTVPAMLPFHPWRRLRDLAHVTLEWHDGGRPGTTRHSTATISLRRGMDQAKRRSALAHELQHLDRGPCQRINVGKDELAAAKAAACQLLPSVRAIADAYIWARGDLEAAAEELWVDPPTLRIRLQHMTHPAERAYLRRRLEAEDWT